MTVTWSDTAIDHLLGIFEYVSQDSRVYAIRLVDRLTRRSEQIADFPYSGRTVPEYDDHAIREVVDPPYRLIYRVAEERIEILAIVHAASSMPRDFPL